MNTANKRMAVNTAILYFKLVFTIVVNLYSTRLILGGLGVEDYGIVNLISGIVAMLSFVNTSMTVSTQRYLSVSYGKNDLELQLRIFNTSIVLHVLIGLIIVGLLELAIPVVFHSAIQIPSARVNAARVLYQLTILGTFFTIVSVPYDATLNAHENMLVYSIASIIESLIRLLGAILLLKYQNDRLVFYGLLIVAIRFVSFCIKSIYSRLKYSDAVLKRGLFSSSLMREMFSFSTWNAFGAFALTARNQGIAFVLNIFKGVVINSAYGIATQVLGQLSNFVATIQKAMNPQIMQREGAGNSSGMLSLALKQSKYSSFLLLFFLLPLMFEMPYVLKLWLKTVPEYSIDFCRLIIVLSFFQQLTSGLQSAIQARGDIRKYQITISCVLLLNIPLAFFILSNGLHVSYVLLGMVMIECVCLIIRVFFAHKLVGLRYEVLFKELLKPVALAYFVSFGILSLLHKLPYFSTSHGFFAFFVFFILSCLITAVIILFSLNNEERRMIRSLIRVHIGEKVC